MIGGLANAMRWLELLAAGLYAYQITGSGFATAAVTAARTLPLLLFGALAGAVSESINRQKILTSGMLATSVVSTLLATAAAADYLGVLGIAIGSFFSGTVWATEMSTRRRMVGEAAGPGRVAQAIALDSVTNAGTRLVGPVLGGVLFEWLGLAGAYALSACIQLACAILASGLPYHQQTRPIRPTMLFRDIATGLRFARTQPSILMVYAITIVMNAFGFSYTGQIAPLGRSIFEVSPTLVGVLAAAEPLGGIAGGLILASGTLRLPPRVVFIGGTLVFFASLLVMTAFPVYWLALLVLVLGGLGTAGFGNMQSTLILTEAPVEMRSRLMGIVSVCIGTGPLGILLAGAISDRVGPAMSVLSMALVGSVITVLISFRLASRRSHQ